MYKKKCLLVAGLLSLMPLTAMAQQQSTTHVVVASQCLIDQLHLPYAVLSSKQSFLLIKTNDAGIDALAEAKQSKQGKVCGGFIDVTAAWESNKQKPHTSQQKADGLLKQYLPAAKKGLVNASDSYAIQYQPEVKQLLSQMNPQRMWTDLTALTDTATFPNRYSRSDYGVKAANWIKKQVEDLAQQNGRQDVHVYLVETGGYKQPSVVAKIGDSNEPGVVIGGHMDTLNSNFELKPGADDDGTGTVTVLETTRTILNSGMKFKKPIYVIWYAAEEMGLVGSQNVVRDFKRKNIPVAAAVQFDMTGYAPKNDYTMWLMDDYVSTELTTYMESLIKEYVKRPVKHSRCGYGCSDHASWTQGGVPAAMPFESSMNADNPYIHTSKDTMDKLSLTHMTDYAMLAIAAAVELAEPVK